MNLTDITFAGVDLSASVVEMDILTLIIILIILFAIFSK